MKRIIIPQSLIPALRDGRKTQHRVLFPHPETSRTMKYAGQLKDGTWMLTDHVPPEKWDSWFPAEYLKGGGIKCPYKVGEQFWVAETWQRRWKFAATILYRADLDSCGQCPTIVKGERVCLTPHDPWRSPPTMPRWAARFVLTIADVRVERVQDVTEYGLIEEGCTPQPQDCDICTAGVCSIHQPPRGQFAAYWDATHGPGAWTRNDWVWVPTFTVRQMPGGGR